MKCTSCSYRYPESDIVDNVAHFVCSKCGHSHAVKNYQGFTKAQIIEKIEAAFSGVTLGHGIGLFEAQAIDDYENEAEQKRRRKQDEKTNWNAITPDSLQSCHSSLSFFDADGMRFHLPAFIIGSIKGEVEDPLFQLTNLGHHLESRLDSLNIAQHQAVLGYLTWCLTEEEYGKVHPDIVRAIAGYWAVKFTNKTPGTGRFANG